MRILMATDAWKPQVNGVVNTLERLSETLAKRGVELVFLTPDSYRTLPVPSYPEIRLALAAPAMVSRAIDAAACDHIHIVTEGPLGVLARRHCIRRGRPFTTSYHTRFPEYVSARLPVPESWIYAFLRMFHNAAAATLVPTPSMAAELAQRGFTRLNPWTRGVDTAFFRPDRRRDLPWPGPVFLSVGRIAVEKNLEGFLDLDLPGSKVIVGEGPELDKLKTKYPAAHFLGFQSREDLADLYASADVFVFPSRTDTFGNVIIEALASGTPVAGYPVTGPIDIVGDGIGGAVDEDLRVAALKALTVSRNEARERASHYTWDVCADQFMAAMRSTFGEPIATDGAAAVAAPA